MTSKMRIVGTFNLVDGNFVSTDKNRSDFNAGKAVPIPADQIASYYPLKATSSINVGGTLNRHSRLAKATQSRMENALF